MDSRLDQEFEEYAYRVYISESFRVGFNLNKRFCDIIEEAKETCDEEDAEEIVRHVMEQAGLRFED